MEHSGKRPVSVFGLPGLDHQSRLTQSTTDDLKHADFTARRETGPGRFEAVQAQTDRALATGVPGRGGGSRRSVPAAVLLARVPVGAGREEFALSL